VEILLTVALMYGITFSIKDAKLFDVPRSWLTSRVVFFASLLSCPFCVGFHSGWISFVLLRSAGISDLPWIQGLLIYAFVGATVSYVIDVVMVLLEGDD
jgi:hypothetical protein